MTKSLLLLLSIFTINLSLQSQTIDSFFDKSDAFFNIYVKNNKVDYEPLIKNDIKLDEILKIAQNIDLSNENNAIVKAFWINAYNLTVIKTVISKYPVKSPLDISGFFDKIIHNLADKKVTLNDIENKMLRAKYKDPRFHFVLVCGANGCPPILNKAYLPFTLEEQLNKQTRLGVNNPNFIKVNEKTRKVQLSQIFEWYKEDFVSKDSQEIDFLNKYRINKIDDNYKISYYTYDWNLNKVK